MRGTLGHRQALDVWCRCARRAPGLAGRRSSASQSWPGEAGHEAETCCWPRLCCRLLRPLAPAWRSSGRLAAIVPVRLPLGRRVGTSRGSLPIGEKKNHLLDVIIKQKRTGLNGKASSHVRGRTTWKVGLFLCLIIEKQSRFWPCIHPPDLNEAIKRQHFPIKTLDKVAAKLSEAKYSLN